MGLYLPGGDIHDFLACLGKHAVEKVSLDLPDLITVEPDCCDIVFVEDTDEVTDCVDGVSLANNKKTVAADGWGKSMQKEDNAGWGAEPSSEARNDAMPSDTGWGRAEIDLHHGSGWGNEQAAVKDACWDSVEQDRVEEAAPMIGEGGKHEAASNSDWDSVGDVDTKPPAAQTGTWDSMDAQHPRNGILKGGLIHPSRRSMHIADSTEDSGENKRQSGNFAPSGTNTVPLGTRKRFTKTDGNTGVRKDEQLVGTDHMGWGSGAPSLAGDIIGWGGSNREEEKTHVNATEQGSHQNDCASGMDWETSQPMRSNSKDDNPGEGGWQSVSECEMPGMDSWGNDTDWNCKGTMKTYATFSANPSDGWDSMDGQSARKGGTRLADISDETEKPCVDEQRSGKFAPSGSNTIPLGKRSSATKPYGSNKQPESMMAKGANTYGDNTGLVNCETKTTPAEDLGWNSSNQEEEKKMFGKGFEEGLSNDGWGSASECKRVSAGQQGIENDNMRKGDWNSHSKDEGSADLSGWGSEGKVSEKVQNDGWGNINSASPSVLQTDNCPEASSQGWDAGGFKSSDTQSSRGFGEQGATLRPRKSFNRDTPSDSWAGFASRSPQPQSSRPRLRSLMNFPEYAELNELYKAANRILHHNDYQLGDKLNTEDETFILEKILVHHRDKEAKVGCGVDYVMIDSHAEHQVSCFWVVRKDGSKTDFSYWKCLESLYESKYTQGAFSEGVKKETSGGWNLGLNSKASATDHQGAGDCSGAPTEGTWDKEKAEGSSDTGVISAGLARSMSDKEETKECWGMGASSVVPVGEAKDRWNMGASSVAHTKDLCKQGNRWDMWCGSAAPIEGKHDQEGAQKTGDMEANFAANVCDQPSRWAVLQEEAKDGWGT